MKKLKYLAAVLIGIAGLGLQQATADFGPTTNPSTLNFSNGQGTGIYGTVTVSNLTTNGLGQQVATITFQAAPGYFFLDGNIVDVNLTGNSATLVAGSVTEVPAPGSISDFSGVQYGANVDGFGKFTIVLDNNSADNKETQISFQVTNLSSSVWTIDTVLAFNSKGWDAAAHYIDNTVGGTGLTYFAGEGTTGSFVPDGGTTVMLLGIGLSMLGMARRFVRS
jgi:hypothetical protein